MKFSLHYASVLFTSINLRHHTAFDPINVILNMFTQTVIKYPTTPKKTLLHYLVKSGQLLYDFRRLQLQSFISYHTGRRTNRQTDRQTDGRTDRQRDRQRDRQSDRQTDRQTDRQRDKQTEGQTNRQTDRQTDR